MTAVLLGTAQGRRERLGDARSRSLSRIGAGLCAAAAALSGFFFLVRLIGPTTPVTSYGAVDSSIAGILLLAAVCLAVAGVMAWYGRPGSILAALAFATAATWLAPVWVGWLGGPLEVRSLALIAVPFVVPLAAHLPIRALRADQVGSRVRGALAILYAVVGVITVARAATYDPFFDADCWTICAGNVLLVHRDGLAAAGLATAGSAAAVVAGLGLAGWAVLRLTRLRRADRRRQAAVLLPTVALGCALAWWAAIRAVVPREDPTDPRFLAPAVLTSVALAVVAIGVAWSIVVVMRQAEAVRHVADAMDPGADAGTLRATLARTLGDDTVRVVYPLAGGLGFVDEDGASVAEALATPGRSLTAIERRGELMALVDHEAGLDPELLTREIGAAARLAADNERLGVAVRARLRELRESRARIVEASDAARGRLERDLHDGAQQRLLALSYELRLARAAGQGASAERTSALDAAIAEVDGALVDLRELAHGIYPAILAEAGLEAALVSLAEDAVVPVTLEVLDESRCAPSSEAAAYLATVEAVRRAASADAPAVDVGLSHPGRLLRLDVTAARMTDERSWLRIEDRVGAAGGTLHITTTDAGDTRLSVELPCA